ncbi:MAG: ATP-binding cassette domain-containing protein [Phycisphaerae bacterium]|nr:ATP-binding cassette domain-containing protein [Phycisphaerae bacterium]
MSHPAVVFDGVSKQFRRGSGCDTLASLLGAGLRRCIGRRNGQASTKELFWALKEVSFHVRPGEALGIIGPNGAGKSTILKLLAGIMRPEKGLVRVHGRLTALIEVGAGFHGDLTGRENIYLNGAILGMTRREVNEKLDSIIDFAGVGLFIDTPVKRYSTGMQARLGFSIAAHVSPDILLVDEVLSVGDAVFRVRCLERMQELVGSGLTLVFVSHNLEQVRRICPRTVVLQEGRVAFNGCTEQAIEEYTHVLGRDQCPRKADICGSAFRETEVDGSAGPRVLSMRFLGADGKESRSVSPVEPVDIEIRYELSRAIPRLVVEANMCRDFAQNMISLNSLRDGVTFDAARGEGRALIHLPRLSVAGGQYFWNVRMWDADRGTIEADTAFEHPLVVNDKGNASGMLCLERTWAVGDPQESVEKMENGK